MKRQHQGMDRPGVRQVPEHSEEQGKMEENGCEIIHGTPTTLAVKGQMMMIGDDDDDESKHGQLADQQGTQVRRFINIHLHYITDQERPQGLQDLKSKHLSLLVSSL